MMKEGENNLLVILVVFVAVIFSLILVLPEVYAGSTILRADSFNASNNTGTIANLTCRTTFGDVTNVTFYYNTSAGRSAANATPEMLNYVTNTSTNQTTNFSLLNVDVSGLADANTYHFWCRAHNSTGASTGFQNSSLTNITHVTIDNTAPSVFIFGKQGNDIGYADNATAYKNTTDATFNVTIVDAIWLTDGASCTFDVNGTNETVAISKANSTWGYCNSTHLNLTGLSDGVRISNIYMTDSLSNRGINNTYYVHIDTSNPSASASCTPASVVEGSTVTCSCSGSDSVTSVNSSSDDDTPSTLSAGTFTYSCSVTDQAGNSVTDDATYIVEDSGGSSSGGSGSGSGIVTTSKIHSFTKVTPGSAAIVEDFESDIGVRQIQVEVNNEAQGVKVTVKKYNGKPAAVSVAKSGKVDQYLEIDVSNVADKLAKATVQFKVMKSWVSGNGLERDGVAVFKFNDASDVWEEQTTAYSDEDDTYYYYDVELDSFSFFAISEKSTVDEGDTGGDTEGTGTGETTPSGGDGIPLWAWVIIAIAIIVIAAGWGAKRNKR